MSDEDGDEDWFERALRSSDEGETAVGGSDRVGEETDDDWFEDPLDDVDADDGWFEDEESDLDAAESVVGDRSEREEGDAAETTDSDPFGGTQEDSESNDPFGGTQEESESDDPFGGTQEESESDDPFGGTQEESESDDPSGGTQEESGSDDPFGGTQEESGSDDPFGGTQGDPGSDDPFGGAQEDSGSDDPFGGTQEESGSDDPFGGAQEDSGSDDPFGGAQEDSGSDDPFGGSQGDTESEDSFGGAQAQAGSDDPFGGVQGDSESDDPFGGVQAQAGGDDPFGGTQAPGPGGGGGDPFGEGFGDAMGGGMGGGGGGTEFDEEEFESEIDRLDIGIEGLDDMILGGIPVRSLMAVIGGPGTGKTTFGLQFLRQAMRNGGSGVYITLEETEEAIISTAEEKGWEFGHYVDENQLVVVAMDPIEMANSLESIRGDISRLVNDFGADRLVLDSVSLLEMMYDHPAKRRSEVFGFARSLKGAGVTTMLTSEANADNPYQSRHGLVEYLVDAVFVLQYVRPNEFQETRLAVEIQKIRDANHSRETKPYDITNDGISVHRQANIF